MHRYCLLILRHQCKLRLDLVTFGDVSNFIGFSQSISTTTSGRSGRSGRKSQKVITLSGRRFITVSGGFITLSGSYYIIGRFLLHYRAVITVSGVYYIIGWYNTRRSSSTGDVSLPSGVGGIAELDGGISIHAAVNELA